MAIQLPQPKPTSFGTARKLGQAKTKEFSLVTQFLRGYRNREDVTNLPEGVLIAGSQNVLTDVTGRVGNRRGYTLDGASSTVIAPILSAFDWEQHTGITQHLRAGFLSSAGNDGKLQFRYVASAGDYYNGTTYTAGQVAWLDLLTGLSSTKFNFTDYWDNTFLQSHLLFVDGANSAINEWSGGVATLASATSTSITINGSQSWAELGFYSTVQTVGNTATLFNITNTSGNTWRYTYSYLGTVSVTAAGNTVTGTGTQFTKTFAIGDYFVLTDTGEYYKISAIADDTHLTITGGAFLLTIPNGHYWRGVQSSGASRVIETGSYDPNITAALLPIGLNINITSPGGFNPLNTGKFTITGSGVQYFEVTNASGVAENNKPLNGSITYVGAAPFQQNSFVMNGVTYSATGGWETNTVVGVLPDPTANDHTTNSIIYQTPIISGNGGIQGLASFPNNFSCDLIANLRNQIYVGSLTNNTFYVSKTNNYRDFGYSTPVRGVGQGAAVTLDGRTTAFVPQEDYMTIFAGKDQIYQTDFTLSADLTNESFQVLRLKTTAGQGTQSQGLTTKIANDVAYVSNEPIVNTLGRVDNVVLTPQITDISYSIVNDINNYNFADGSACYFQKYLFVAVPKEGLVRIYNMTNDTVQSNGQVIGNYYWEAPQLLPISCFSIIDGELYGHSYQTSESYKLFSGWSDNKHPIEAIAAFSYQSFGTRDNSKSGNSCYVEGYINPNTTLMGTINYDYNAVSGTAIFEISGTDTRIVSSITDDSSLGKKSLGKAGLGQDSFQDPTAMPPKFRVFKTFPRTPFYEESTVFSSAGKDYQWSILSFGINQTPTSEGNNAITE